MSPPQSSPKQIYEAGLLVWVRVRISIERKVLGARVLLSALSYCDVSNGPL